MIGGCAAGCDSVGAVVMTLGCEELVLVEVVDDLGAFETAVAAPDGLAAAADEVEETCFGPAGVATVTVLLAFPPPPPLVVEDDVVDFGVVEVVFVLVLEAVEAFDVEVSLGAFETAVAAPDGLAAAADEVEETCFGPAGVATVTVLLAFPPPPLLGALDAVFVVVEDDVVDFGVDEVLFVLELEAVEAFDVEVSAGLLLFELPPPPPPPPPPDPPPPHIRDVSCIDRRSGRSPRFRVESPSCPP